MERLLVIGACHCHGYLRPAHWYVVYLVLHVSKLTWLRADDDILMALPELYYYGLKGTYFGMTNFTIYMLDALYQVCFAFSC